MGNDCSYIQHFHAAGPPANRGSSFGLCKCQAGLLGLRSHATRRVPS
jgi:hypothetical protein